MNILVTGATGVVGSEVCRLLARTDHEVVGVARRARPASPVLPWQIGTQAPPPSLLRRWDVVIHTAASTRWTLTRAAATAANIDPLRAVLRLTDRRTRVVHVSTAYVDRDPSGGRDGEFAGYRNGYEWSKMKCEEVLHGSFRGDACVIRPPLIIGRSTDGYISRFNGLYTITHALTTGLGAALVGAPDGYAELAPLDQVAGTVVERAISPAGTGPDVEVIAGGDQALTMPVLMSVIADTLNDWRKGRSVPPVEIPPIIPPERWHRFFFPLAKAYLTPVQLEAVRLLSMFESYASMNRPFTPTRQVTAISDTVVKCIRYWADTKTRAAMGMPRSWVGVGS